MWMMHLHLHINQKSDYDDDDENRSIKIVFTLSYSILKCCYHMMESWTDITPCNKIDKPLVVYRFSKIM